MSLIRDSYQRFIEHRVASLRAQAARLSKSPHEHDRDHADECSAEADEIERDICDSFQYERLAA